MPTIEELQKKIDELEGNYKVQLATKAKELETAIAHSTQLEGDLKNLNEQLGGYKKAEREKLVAEAHAVAERAGIKEDISKFSDDTLKGMILGGKSQTEANSAPKAGRTSMPAAGENPNKPLSSEDKFKQIVNL